jgi:hypothetical protein
MIFRSRLEFKTRLVAGEPVAMDDAYQTSVSITVAALGLRSLLAAGPTVVCAELAAAKASACRAGKRPPRISN